MIRRLLQRTRWRLMFLYRRLTKVWVGVWRRRVGVLTAWSGLPHLLLTLAGVATLATVLLLLASSDAGVHIVCPCEQWTITGEREARYLSPAMGETDPTTGRQALFDALAQEPSLPLPFLLSAEAQGRRCALTPGVFSVRWRGVGWQEAQVGYATFLLYSAHYDSRDDGAGPLIRILTVVDTPSPPTPTCQLYSSPTDSPVATRAIRMDFLHWQYPATGQWHPFLITCRAGAVVARAVSIVSGRCQSATNALAIVNGPIQEPLVEEWHPLNDATHDPLQKQERQQNEMGLVPLQNQGQLREEVDQSLFHNLGQNRNKSTLDSLLDQRQQRKLSARHQLPESLKQWSKKVLVALPDESLTRPLHTTKSKIKHRRNAGRKDTDAQDRSQSYSEAPTTKKDLALCHKFLYNELRDDSKRLVEWLEAARSWGVQDVTLYLHSAHHNVLRVLDHYVQQGYLTVLPWSNPGHHPNAPALQRAFYDTQRYAVFTLENIPYTDCLLRYSPTHRYVAVWDMDEFLLPAAPYTTLTQMVDHAKARWFDARAARCGFDSIKKTPNEDQPYRKLLEKFPVHPSASLEKLPNRLQNKKLSLRIKSNMKNREGFKNNVSVVDFIKSDEKIVTDSHNASENDAMKTKINGLNFIIQNQNDDGSQIECRPPASYLGVCTYFFDDLKESSDEVNKGLHILSHVTRSMKFTAPRVHTKAIHDTSRALGLHAHFALYTLDGAVDRDHDLYDLYPANEGYLAHYRSKCQGEDQTECDTKFRTFTMRDERMWQHRTGIAEKATRTLEALGIR